MDRPITLTWGQFAKVKVIMTTMYGAEFRLTCGRPNAVPNDGRNTRENYMLDIEGEDEPILATTFGGGYHVLAIPCCYGPVVCGCGNASVEVYQGRNRNVFIGSLLREMARLDF